VISRRIAVAVPAHDEAEYIGDCLRGLANLQTDGRISELRTFVFANNCADETIPLARAFQGALSMQVIDADLPPDRAHAGWARRAALDAAANWLRSPGDLLLSTDADTVVTGDWLRRTLDHIDCGYDAVAGVARLQPRDLRHLAPDHRRRLAAVRRYQAALDYLKAAQSFDEPWPRHFYEGGASMGFTLDAYCKAGGAPTPPVGEDKAMFDAIRLSGGVVRHPLDVRVVTSARLRGRAPGGASDTLVRWGRQDEDEPIRGLISLRATLGTAGGGASPLTFSRLDEETAKARTLVRALRERQPLAMAS
jgi:hypothetical protein